jgi:Protein of unknown function (DUF2505)
VHAEYRYAVPPLRLFEVLTNLGFLIARNERFGGVGAPTVERSGSTVVVRTVRRIPLEHAPVVAHRYLGDGQLVETARWELPRADATEVAASVAVDTGRIPMDMSGRHEIRVVSTGCLHVASVDIKVRIPFVGGAIAAQVSGLMRQLLTTEMDFAQEWLTR